MPPSPVPPGHGRLAPSLSSGRRVRPRAGPAGDSRAPVRRATRPRRAAPLPRRPAVPRRAAPRRSRAAPRRSGHPVAEPRAAPPPARPPRRTPGRGRRPAGGLADAGAALLLAGGGRRGAPVEGRDLRQLADGELRRRRGVGRGGGWGQGSILAFVLLDSGHPAASRGRLHPPLGDGAEEGGLPGVPSSSAPPPPHDPLTQAFLPSQHPSPGAWAGGQREVRGKEEAGRMRPPAPQPPAPPSPPPDQPPPGWSRPPPPPLHPPPRLFLPTVRARRGGADCGGVTRE